MLPITHVITSVFAVSVSSLFFSLDLEGFLLWIFSAAFVTVFLDLDHVFFPLLRKEKRYIFRRIMENPFAILMDLKSFKDEIRFPGLGYIRLVSHLLFSAGIIGFSLLSLKNFVIPVSFVITGQLLANG